MNKRWKSRIICVQTFFVTKHGILLANVARACAIDRDQAIFIKQKEKGASVLQGIIRYQIGNLLEESAARFPRNPR